MRIFVKRFKDQHGQEKSVVKFDTTDGEEISSEHAMLLLLDQIDDRLCDIAQSIEMSR